MFVMLHASPQRESSHSSSSVFFGDQQSSFFQPIIQPKLNVNNPGDKYEQEADAMADKVSAMPESQAHGSPPPVQRKCAKCEEEEKQQGLMRKATHDGGFQAPPHFESTLAETKGSGTPLPADTRGFMENAFQADLSAVRIHQNAAATAMSSTIQAKAFTHGSDIYFNSGQYNPHSREGRHLLAHELTHTQQQGKAGGALQRQPASSINRGNSIPVEKWGVEVEQAYRRTGLYKEAHAVMLCRESGKCDKLITEAEAYEAYRKGRRIAGMPEPKNEKNIAKPQKSFESRDLVSRIDPGTQAADASGRSVSNLSTGPQWAGAGALAGATALSVAETGAGAAAATGAVATQGATALSLVPGTGTAATITAPTGNLTVIHGGLSSAEGAAGVAEGTAVATESTAAAGVTEGTAVAAEGAATAGVAEGTAVAAEGTAVAAEGTAVIAEGAAATGAVEAGSTAAASGAGAGMAVVAIPLVAGAILYVSIHFLSKFTTFLEELETVGFTVLPTPLGVCIGACHPSTTAPKDNPYPFGPVLGKRNRKTPDNPFKMGPNELPETHMQPDDEEVDQKGCRSRFVASKHGRTLCHTDYAKYLGDTRLDYQVTTRYGLSADFDGKINNKRIVIEVKTGHGWMLNKHLSPERRAERKQRLDGIVNQSEQQLEVANACGYELYWFFNEKPVADLIRSMVRVNVVYKPYKCKEGSDNIW
jgi:hypothetical protein